MPKEHMFDPSERDFWFPGPNLCAEFEYPFRVPALERELFWEKTFVKCSSGCNKVWKSSEETKYVPFEILGMENSEFLSENC